ncbi:MAG TPA: GNAT family protein, partial [Candidatus Limnocylindrales bacterium]|nr:GNAT family protein [Candidatus Limnocylindrales bacterium]
PRTHTLKVKRDVVRRWAVDEESLPVHEGVTEQRCIPRIETERLLLRDWREEDLEPFARMNADARVMPPRALSTAPNGLGASPLNLSAAERIRCRAS